MNIISLIGNCQTLTLCFYLQQLLNSSYEINWLLYHQSFKRHLGSWSNKCGNRILDYNTYQEVQCSEFSREIILQDLKKPNCKLIKLPSIYLDYKNFDISIKNLEEREKKLNVDIIVSKKLKSWFPKELMLTVFHPKTFLFLEIIRDITFILNTTFFEQEKVNHFLKDDNFMQLPSYRHPSNVINFTITV
jgi:hypothetical protein